VVSESRTLELLELHCVLAVARRASVTAAAADLGMSKSAVSKYVTRFEERSGVRLFERSTRRVVPTPAGTALLPRVESLLAEADLLLDHAREVRSTVAGVVRLAATPEFGGLVAEALLPALGERYPELRLVMTATYAREDLKDPAYDLAFRIGALGDDGLSARRLGELRRVPVASPAFAQAHGLGSVQELARAPCLLFSGSRTAATWTLETPSGERHSVPVEASFSVESFTTLAALARAGHGVALIPEFLVRADLSEGRLVVVPPGHSAVPSDVWLAHRVGAERVARVRAVLDLATELVPACLAPQPSKPGRSPIRR
jgi:DNA-binding transcriptional LysR family regulator